MATVEVDGSREPGVPMLDEIRHAAERRLRELEPLIEEAACLRSVLRALDERPSKPDERPTGDARRSEVSEPQRPSAGPRHRAAKGSNKRAIIALIAERPGVTPAEIAASTGMKRTVVASTVSRLKRHGELCDHEHGGLRIPSVAHGGDQQPAVGRLTSLSRRRAA